MANFHTDEWIMTRLNEHYEEAKQYFDESRIVGIFYQGSANYGLDYENSDVDTKLIITPTFEDIAMNHKPISTTHVRANEEHIDFKDIRLYLQTFRKQNLNFVEILFTDYCIINPKYKKYWEELTKYNEEIARYNPVRAIRTMKGIAMEKYHAMEHQYPSKIDVIDKFGYDPKQLHHLLRVKTFMQQYLDDYKYLSCIKCTDEQYNEYLKNIKKGMYSLDAARQLGAEAIEKVKELEQQALIQYEDKNDEKVEELLNKVQLDIMREAILNDRIS